jgi:glucose-6-phosphate-specific signal transduction histidine kinase
MTHEKELRGLPGLLVLTVIVLVAILGTVQFVNTARAGDNWSLLLWILVVIAALSCLAGLTVVYPNEARVVTLFGDYKGSLKRSGFWWVNP